jgi:flagellar biosynthesis protein FlhG
MDVFNSSPVPGSSMGIEPARLQFIEREFRDVFDKSADASLLRQIHDALFVEGKPIAVVRNQLWGRQRALRVIAVTSGKGGVGKTTVAVNLAVALAERGLRVLLFDADLGMANVHVFAGVTPRGTLLDVVEGRATIAQILSNGPAGVRVVCGASGVAGLADLNLRVIEFLGGELARFADAFDLLLIDTGAGISSQVMRFLAMANEIVVVATPNLASTLDAYGLIKVVREARLPARVHVLVNQSEDDAQAESVFERLRGCAERFLQFSPMKLEALRRDPAIEAANQSRQPLVLAKPRNKNARRFATIAEQLAELEPLSQATAVPSDAVAHSAAA